MQGWDVSRYSVGRTWIDDSFCVCICVEETIFGYRGLKRHFFIRVKILWMCRRYTTLSRSRYRRTNFLVSGTALRIFNLSFIHCDSAIPLRRSLRASCSLIFSSRRLFATSNSVVEYDFAFDIANKIIHKFPLFSKSVLLMFTFTNVKYFSHRSNVMKSPLR